MTELKRRGGGLGPVAIIVLCWWVMPAFGQGAPGAVWSAAGHAYGVDGAAFSVDGSLAATASNDRTIKVWRVSDGALLRSLSADDVGTLHAVVFAPDGSRVIGAGGSGAVGWDLATGEVVASYCCLETAYGLAFSPDGATLAVTGSETGLDECTLLFSYPEGALIRKLQVSNQRYAFGAAFTADGEYLVTSSGAPFAGHPNEGVVRWWRIADGEEVRTIDDHVGRIAALDISPDGLLLATGGEDGDVRLYEAANGVYLRSLSGHLGEVAGVAFSPDSSSLVSVAEDGAVRYWDVATGVETAAAFGHAGPVGAVAWSADGEHVLSAGGEVFGTVDFTEVFLWAPEALQPSRQFSALGSQVRSVDLSADGSRAVVSCGAGVTTVLRALDGQVVRTIQADPFVAVYDAALSPAGDFVAVATSAGAAVWSVDDGSLVHELSPGTAVYNIDFAPAGDRIVSGTVPLRVWRASDGLMQYELPGVGGGDVVFAPGGEMFAVTGNDGVALRQTANGALVRTLDGNTATVRCAAFSGDGSLVAGGTSSGEVLVWNATSGALVQTGANGGAVDAIAMSPDGAYVLTGGAAQASLRVWRVANGQMVQSFDRELGLGISGLAMTPYADRFFLARRDATCVAAKFPFGPAEGDFNADGGWDGADLSLFAECVAGPGSGDAPAGCTAVTFAACDLDGDFDVDLGDFGLLQMVWGGASR